METQITNQLQGQPQVVIVKSQKSTGMAILLALFFGPLGMLYSTIAGGIVMFFVNILMLLLTAGLGLIITWPIGIVWAAISARITSPTSRSGKLNYY